MYDVCFVVNGLAIVIKKGLKLNKIREILWIPLVRELTQRIVSGHYPPGFILPNEINLGIEMGLSRTVIREGMKVLTDKGLVLGQRGVGTQVLPMSKWNSFDKDILKARLLLGDKNRVLSEIFFLRRLIEPELAGMAAKQLDDAGSQKLEARFLDLEKAKDNKETYSNCDGEFHECIAELSSNSIMIGMLKSLREPMHLQRQITGSIADGSTSLTHSQHQAVYKCILARDSKGATKAMLEHLLWAEERLDRVVAQEPDLIHQFASQ